MSHTYEAPNGTRFHYNSDMSGKVRLEAVGEFSVDVDAYDLIAFIAHCYVVPKKIERLEQGTAEEILGVVEAAVGAVKELLL